MSSIPRYTILRLHRPDGAPTEDGSAGAVRRALAAGRSWMLGRQHRGGYWSAQATSDALFEADAVLLLAMLGRRDDARIPKLARTVAAAQRDHGGWGRSGAEFDLSLSVRAYFALKLAGAAIDEPELVAARKAIVDAGGGEHCDAITRFFLAALGQISYEACPEPPIESLTRHGLVDESLERLPADAAMSTVPLAIIHAARMARDIPAAMGVEELFVDKPAPATDGDASTGGVLFDSLSKLWRRGRRPFSRREKGLAIAREQLLEMTRPTTDPDSLDDVVFPELLWRWTALSAMGFDARNAHMQACEAAFNALYEEGEGPRSSRIRAAATPAKDTSLAVHGLLTAGVDNAHVSIREATDWLLRIDDDAPFAASDIAQRLAVLHEQLHSTLENAERLPVMLRLYDEGEDDTETDDDDRQRVERFTRATVAIEQGVERLLTRQNGDGGWSATPWTPPHGDRVRRRLRITPLLTGRLGVPWASCSAATGAVLETLGRLGHDSRDRRVAWGVDFLLTMQQGDGLWTTVGGGDSLHATWRALAGLESVGHDVQSSEMRRAVERLLRTQHESGGWVPGDNDASSTNPTCVHTAFAILALLAAGEADHPAVERGVQYLVRSQRRSGAWRDASATVTLESAACRVRDPLRASAYALLALAKYTLRATEAGVRTLPAWRVVHVPEPADECDPSTRAAY